MLSYSQQEIFPAPVFQLPHKFKLRSNFFKERISGIFLFDQMFQKRIIS